MGCLHADASVNPGEAPLKTALEVFVCQPT